ncbi:hypothetical protein D3C72_2037440 [compost metagenome]
MLYCIIKRLLFCFVRLPTQFVPCASYLDRGAPAFGRFPDGIHASPVPKHIIRLKHIPDGKNPVHGAVQDKPFHTFHLKILYVKTVLFI